MINHLKPSTFERWAETVCQFNPGLIGPTRAITSIEELLAWLAANSLGEDEAVQGLAKLIDSEWRPDINRFSSSPEFIDWFPISLARRKAILAGLLVANRIEVLVGSIAGVEQLDHIRRRFAMPIVPVFTTREMVVAEINRAYQGRHSETQSTIDTLDRDNALSQMRISAGGEDLLATSGKSPVIKLTNSLIFDAIRSRASDIHIQPYAEHLQVRFRIDGLLFDQFEIPRESQDEILSRVKVMGKMNIAEKRLPQDGRATVSLGDRSIDLRIASLPTSYGERVVIRLLDKGARLYNLEDLGMSPGILEQFRRLIHREHGLFLVTGPTGGGKSTTLYAALQELNVKDKNVVTLEDPIEYQLSGISQTQVNEKKGMTFATGLRNVLRQDPDIIMIGEIRDQETAEMAIQSALTGHMVYSTLHTNDATSAVTRLLDLGIEPYLVASSLAGVLAQRLVRRICEHCRTEIMLAPDQVEQVGDGDSRQWMGKAWKGNGCSECRSTGYLGRLGIFEMVIIDEPIRSLIQRQANASEIRRTAMQGGMKLLRDDGMTKVLAGKTTLEEVLRVSMDANE